MAARFEVDNGARCGAIAGGHDGTIGPIAGASAMTRAELVDDVAHQSSLTRRQSEVIVDAVFSAILDSLRRGDKIELRGFGSFRIRQRGSRSGRNPKTGEGVLVPPRKVPFFKPGKELRDLVNRG
jgi:integration host factor subunit beta